MADNETDDTFDAEVEQLTAVERRREEVAEALGAPLDAVKFMNAPVLWVWVSDAGDDWKVQYSSTLSPALAAKLLHSIADDWAKEEAASDD